MTNHLSKVLGLGLALALFAPNAFAQAQFQNASLKSRTSQRESDLRSGTEGTLQDLFDHILSPPEIDQAVAAENARLERVKNAATLEEFLQVATPAEIAADTVDENNQPIDTHDDESMDNLISPIGSRSLVTINVNLSSQTMSMTSPQGSVSDRVASGRNGYRTERIARSACYHPRAVEKLHYSRKYKAPMPLSVFITGGYALHVGSLGIRSHGCVHLSWATAQKVYDAVRANGARNTCIHINR